MIVHRRTFMRGAALLLPLVFGRQADAKVVKQHYQMNRFSIAGFQHYSGPRLLNRLNKGTLLRLIAETNNRYDCYAVRIEWRGHKLGYVPRSDNRHISRLLLQGAKLQARVIERKTNADPWQALRVEVDVEAG